MTAVEPTSPAIARTLARHPRPLGGDTARSVGPAVVNLSGMVLNNREAESGGYRETPSNHPVTQQLSIPRKPSWIRARVPGGAGYERLKAIVDEHRLHTVCQEASC